ncbi:MAG: Carbohydrate-binding and sugar hydrolysis [Frankiales bacterium]|nr:Carbohydrate-binding and sugar hydrolysis [Frankiales bacterium]
MQAGRSRRWGRVLGVLVSPVLVVPALAAPASAAATVLYVDDGSGCSDKGSGTTSKPFCTIGKGASVATAGQTVQVAAGTYSGSITVGKSGTSSEPVTLAGAPGAMLTSSGVGITVSGKSWVVIRGFEVGPTGSDGIRVTGGSSHVTVVGNNVHDAGTRSSGKTANGIDVSGTTTDSTIDGNVVHDNSDSGIYVSGSAHRILVVGNETYGNARGYTRAAPGIDIRATDNTVRGNYSHHNEDSGVQVRGGADRTVVVGNRTDHNGDHGIDVLDSQDCVLVGNSVFKNVTAGINDEGTSPGVTIKNNISVDNGIDSPRTSGNIRVDKNSYSGSVVDSNLTFLSTKSADYVWNGKSYSSLAAFKLATGQEARGIQADPKWRNAAAGDLRLLAGSPAIDSADSGAPEQLARDIDGVARADDPATRNTGIGPRSYDDRGAYEFR